MAESQEITEAVCVHTRKIYDSCRDKDCLEDLRLYPTASSLTLKERYTMGSVVLPAGEAIVDFNLLVPCTVRRFDSFVDHDLLNKSPEHLRGHLRGI